MIGPECFRFRKRSFSVVSGRESHRASDWLPWHDRSTPHPKSLVRRGDGLGLSGRVTTRILRRAVMRANTVKQMNPVIDAVFSGCAGLLVIVASYYLVIQIERRAEEIRGRGLSRWARLLIPVPAILFLIANIDSILSFLAYLQENPRAGLGRYSGKQAWNTDRFFWAGIGSVLVLPTVILPGFSWRLMFTVWGGYLAWLFFFGIHLVATGVPFQD